LVITSNITRHIKPEDRYVSLSHSLLSTFKSARPLPSISFITHHLWSSLHLIRCYTASSVERASLNSLTMHVIWRSIIRNTSVGILWREFSFQKSRVGVLKLVVVARNYISKLISKLHFI